MANVSDGFVTTRKLADVLKDSLEMNSPSTSQPFSIANPSCSIEKKKKFILEPDDQLRTFLPLLQNLYKQDVSMPFREPVDPIQLGEPSYFDIIKEPIDLSTIKGKLEDGLYGDPWDFVDDIWLMFDNAWLFNGKSSSVYICCSYLAEIFKKEIHPVMQNLGYCCGRKYRRNPRTRRCFGKQLCTMIQKDSVYFNYQNEYSICARCFRDIPGDTVTLDEDAYLPQIVIRKNQFVKTTNSLPEMEPFVECLDCGKQSHQICVMHMDQIWQSGFVCETCLKNKNAKREENKFRANQLPTTELDTHIETRVDQFLRKKDAGIGRLIVRVVSSSEKTVVVGPKTKSRFVDTGALPEQFPHKAKTLLAFQEIDGVDVCIFGLRVQEYGSECPPPNQRRVYIAYFDSVPFFQPKQFRTAVYHEILLGYLDYVKKLGYTMAHIWACPSKEGDDLIFHCHPNDQKIPKPKRLVNWFWKMLDKGIIDRIVLDYKDILKQTMEDKLKSVAELPYFEDDFWSEMLKERIRNLESEQKKKRQQAEASAASSSAANNVQVDNTDVDVERRNIKRIKLDESLILSEEIYNSMKKYSDLFWIVRLHPAQTASSLPPIQDPDPLVECDVMDGGEAFLTMAREKGYEFSTLRWAKFSSMAMLYEIHTSIRDELIYTHNSYDDTKSGVLISSSIKQKMEQKQQLQRNIARAKLLHRRIAVTKSPIFISDRSAALSNSVATSPSTSGQNSSSSLALPNAISRVLPPPQLLYLPSHPQLQQDQVLQVLKANPQLAVRLVNEKREPQQQQVNPTSQLPPQQGELNALQNERPSSSNVLKSSSVTNSSSTSQSAPNTMSSTTENRTKYLFEPEVLRRCFTPVLKELLRYQESAPFREPVDPVTLNIPNYFDIIKHPMDLSTIKGKLDGGQYDDPWDFVNDMWLMFDNAWLFNRSSSRVYNSCTLLSRFFEQEMNPVMQSLGYCCGRRYRFSPKTLRCLGKEQCTILERAKYFNYQNQYTYCVECFNRISGDTVTLADDLSQAQIALKKNQFEEMKNDCYEVEPFVECLECGIRLHQICVLHLGQIWHSEFVCDNCLKKSKMKRKENEIRAKKLPTTELSAYIENRVNNYLKKKEAGAREVTVRILSSSKKMTEVKPAMKSRFVDSGKLPDRFPYTAKVLFAFQEIDGVDVCIFGMHVQEYGSECPPPNQRRVYIAYVDTLHYFQPVLFRNAVYHEILLGYLDYVKKLGYTMAHIWASPSTEGDDLIFHCHPNDQKIPKPKRLVDWYSNMLDKGIIERIVLEWNNILKQALDDKLQSAAELPYFEGDLWPIVLEEIIKKSNQLEEQKRQLAGGAGAAENASSASNNRIFKYRVGNSKRGITVNHEMAQIFANMQKHKEFFCAIRLHSAHTAASLPPIQDPDPLIVCDVMDSREAFLTISRIRRYEFSTLRRAKFSSMAMLHELLVQSTIDKHQCNRNANKRFSSVFSFSLPSAVVPFSFRSRPQTKCSPFRSRCHF